MGGWVKREECHYYNMTHNQNKNKEEKKIKLENNKREINNFISVFRGKLSRGLEHTVYFSRFHYTLKRALNMCLHKVG